MGERVTRVLSVELFDAAGSPLVGVTVTADLTKPDVSDNGLVIPAKVIATSGEDGIARLQLWPNVLGQSGSQYKLNAYIDSMYLLKDALITMPDLDCGLDAVLHMAPPTPKPYDEASIELITQRRAEVESIYDDFQDLVTQVEETPGQVQALLDHLQTLNDSAEQLYSNDIVLSVEITETGRLVVHQTGGNEADLGLVKTTGFISRVAAESLGGHRVVKVDVNGKAVYCNSADPDSAGRAIGVSVNAADAGGEVLIQNGGELTDPSFSWDMSQPVYVAADASLTQIAPTPDGGNAYLQIIGWPTAPTTLSISIQTAISF